MILAAVDAVDERGAVLREALDAVVVRELGLEVGRERDAGFVEHALDGVVEIDSLYVGGKPRRDPNYSPPGRGRKGEPKTLKTPALVAVQRPPDVSVGARSGEVRAA